MKIHIVQKGETIWDIAAKYEVDFEAVKDVNPQISSPDMIMPGMKIKIPSSSKPVKHKENPVKEMPKQPIKEQPIEPKPIEKIDTDDVKKPNNMEAKPPIGHQPMIPIEPGPQLESNIPKLPEKEQPSVQKKKEEPILEEKQQPQMPSFNTLPKLEIKEADKMKPESQPHEQTPMCCCQMIHHCHMPNHMMGCHSSPMPNMQPGHMMPSQQQYMMQQRQHIEQQHPGYMMQAQQHPGYMDNVHHHQQVQPNSHYQPFAQPSQQIHQHQNNFQPVQSHPTMEYGPQHEHRGGAGRPFPKENQMPILDDEQRIQAPSFVNGATGHPLSENATRFPQPPLYPAHPRTSIDE